MRKLYIAWDDAFIRNEADSKYILHVEQGNFLEALKKDSLNILKKGAFDILGSGEEILGIPINSPYSWVDTLRVHLKNMQTLLDNATLFNLVFQGNTPFATNSKDYPLDFSQPLLIQLDTEYEFKYFIDYVEYSSTKEYDAGYSTVILKETCQKHKIELIEKN